MSDNSNIQNSLFEAMKIFSESATANSNATITIEGSISAIEDEAAGIYSVEYLGSVFTAHSNSNTTYSVGDSVYILVPDGDFSKEKIVLGLISASASAYTNNIEDGDNYYDVSDNLMDYDIGTIKLSSYATVNKNDNKVNITTHDAGVFGALMKGYLNDYRTFKLSLSAKTALDVEQQSKGNYGIVLYIPIIESAESGEGSQNQTWKTVYLETANFVGTPYRYDAWAPQEVYFTIDEQYTYDDTRIPYYSYFCYDFVQYPDRANIYDIWLKNISLQVVNEMSTDEITGYSLSLKASQGEYYSTFYRNVKTITPTIRVNGKKGSVDKAAVYWFIEDASVKADSEYYSSYGGYGWKCLNTKTNISYNDDGTKSFDYITTVTTLDVDRTDVRAATRFKCTVIYNEKVLSSIITLKSLLVQESIDLTSSKNLTTYNGVTTIAENPDNTYIKDTGYVELSALVYYDGITNVDDNRTKITYSWARYNKDGNYISDDEDFFVCIANNKITLIDGKNYYVTQIRFPVNKVEEFNTVYCTAKYTNIDDYSNKYEEQIGTAKIGIATSEEFDLNLNINGDNIIYKYDTNGNSPMGSAYDGPTTSKVTEITPLTYTITHADGTELTTDEYRYVHFCWKMPKAKNGMFTLNGGTSPSREDDEYYYFEGYGNDFNMLYKIASRYSVKKVKETINLTIVFNGKTLEKSADITFIKEGMAGSNGTNYSAILVYGGMNAEDSASVGYGILNAAGVAQKLKFVYNNNSKKLYRHDYTNNTLIDWSQSQKRIYPQVWRDSTLLTYNTHYTIEYSMFDKDVTNPCFTPELKDDGSCLLSLSSGPTEDNCNILQAKIEVNDGNTSTANSQQIIYAYYPIEVTITDFDTDLIPSMDGGFAEVIYASDGTNPSYDETDYFTINDDEIMEVSDSLIKDYYSISWEAANHIGIYAVNDEGRTTGTKKTAISGKYTSAKLKPDNKYDDGNSKNYVKVTLAFDEDKKAELESQKTEYQSIISANEKLIDAEDQNFEDITSTIDLYNEKIKSWYSSLDEIKPLLSHETTALYNLSKLKDVITETLEYITLQESNNEDADTIKEIMTDLEEMLGIVEEQAEKAETQLKALDGNKGTAPADLVSLEDYKIELSATGEERWNIYLGTEMTSVLKIDIDRLNIAIDDYQSEYVELQADSYTDYLTEYNIIKNGINSVIEKISDTAFTRYIEFKKLLKNVLDDFGGGVSYDYIKEKLQAIETLFSSIATIHSDHTIELLEAAEIEYKNQVAAYQETIDTNNKLIAAIDAILATQNQHIVHIRPIVLYFNRYEMSNINAWDGNKLETGDGSYLLAPQVGAGVKNDDNSFTGMIMGLRSTSSSVSSSNAKQTGMFGYTEGKQSLYLSAETGAAVFGVAGSGGQIIVDPTSRNGSSGAIYSSNYFKADSYDKTTGLPRSINANTSGEGMLINFSEPSIKYGSGYFTVDKNGNLHAGGGGVGDVGGWSIYNTTLQSNNYKARRDGICLDSGNDQIVFGSSLGKIYSGGHTSLGNSSQGFYLSNEGLSIGSKIKISSDGVVQVGSGAVGGYGKHWTIDGGDNSYLAYGTTSFYDSSGVYVGTDGIRLGNSFSVDSDGNLTSTSGHIGGWTIDSNTLSGGGTEMNSNGTITCNKLIANVSGEIAGWKISSNALTGGGTTINSGGRITCSDLIANNSGNIGGWTLSPGSLTGSGLSITPSKISGTGWSWTPSTADITGTIKTSGSTAIGGSGNVGGCSLNNGFLTVNNAHISDLEVDKLTVSGTKVGWRWAEAVTGIHFKEKQIKLIGDVIPDSVSVERDILGYVTGVSLESSYHSLGHVCSSLTIGYTVHKYRVLGDPNGDEEKEMVATLI